MGMFDTVMIPCPKCGEEHDEQVKSGLCILQYYSMPQSGLPNPAPWDVMNGVSLQPIECLNCRAKFRVKVLKEVVITPGEYTVEEVTEEESSPS